VQGTLLLKGCRLANEVTLFGGAAHFCQSASTWQSDDTGLILNFSNV
jgi:hypothetical protein